jgi:putative flippase GtrA
MKVNNKNFFRYLPIAKWAIVGSMTALIDLFFFLVTYNFTNSVFVSNFLSSLFALLFNYTLHNLWSFKKLMPRKYSKIKYLLNLIVFWTANTVLLKILIMEDVPPARAKILLIILLAPFSFISLKNFVFKR